MTELVFVISETNKNSLASLCSVLSRTKKLTKTLDIKFIDEKEINNIDEKAGNRIFCFSFQTPDALRLDELIKEIKGANNILVAGGPHPSGAYNHTLSMGFDFVVVGEGENALIQLLEKLISKKKDFEKIRGLAFKNYGKVIFTGKAAPVDICQFLPVTNKFPYFTPIEITRGCPHGCRFCQTTYLFGKTRHRTTRQIVESAKILVNQGWKKIRFVSPNILSYGSESGFKGNLVELEKMLSSVRKVKGVEKIYAGSFPSEVRPENVTRKALKVLKEYSDNNNVIIGFQSGSEDVLKRMHRGHTVKQALGAVEMALQVGFKVNVDFIFGMPNETKIDEEKTIAVLKKLAKLPKVKVHGHTFLPLPGTPWQNEKPGKISKQLISVLDELESVGRIYGDWREQELMAKKIASLNLGL